MRNFVWEHLISKNVTALMEAKKDNEATDYASEIEEDDSTVTEEEEGQPVEDDTEPNEAEDYTSDVDETTDEPSESEDYSDTSPTDEEVDEDIEDTESGSEEPEDYTSTEDTDNPDDETIDSDEASDYGEESPTDSGSEDGGDNPDDNTEGDETEDNPSDSVTNEEEVDSKIKNLDLHDSFVYMYNRVTDFETKLSIIQNSSYTVSRIITRVNKNLVNLKTAISDYLIYSFENNSYVRNLYNYNHFLESLRLNMIIMGKIKDLIPDAQNN